jgi:hypothetical protein
VDDVGDTACPACPAWLVKGPCRDGASGLPGTGQRLALCTCSVYLPGATPACLSFAEGLASLYKGALGGGGGTGP